VTADKVRSLAAAVAWRTSAVPPVVFTNGVFDLLHPGHVLVLEQARALGGSLVVGVNADDSAQRLNKAPRRPINDAAARARVIAALACVDCVVVFSEDTPETLIEAIEPDVLVKGDDYAASQVPGRAAVERRGGRVHLVPRAAGYSTTAIVERIRAAT